MTKDEREALRAACAGRDPRLVMSRDLLALLDAADERDKLRKALEDVESRLLARTPGDDSRLLSTLMRANLAAIIDNALRPGEGEVDGQG